MLAQLPAQRQSAVGRHDLVVPCCDPERYAIDYGEPDHGSCLLSLETAIEGTNLPLRGEMCWNVFMNNQLEDGKTYVLILTNGSGLYRYDIGDVDGMMGPRSRQALNDKNSVFQEISGGLDVIKVGNYETAYHCLVTRGRLQAGETVLVHGASGATGLAAVHVAKLLGAKVIATGRSSDKLAIVKAEGADHVIDIGPGAGVRGGQIIAQGMLADLMAAPGSATGRCFNHPLIHPLAPRRAVADDHPALVVRNATLHNLKGVSARVPLARLTVVTGVSGSGKSTFARDVLHASLAAAAPVGCAALDGREQIGRLLEVDQTPIGKTPRSCPATYIGFWDAIRKLFAETTEAKLRGWNASRFSFNAGAGRCPVCEGQGQITVEMNFLPDVKLPCEACGGARFNPETLTVQWKGKSVAEVLNMAVEDAVDFFAAHPSIAHPLRLLQDVGLGYLTLGQPSPTLSGGEAQRIKLVSELAKVRGRAGESPSGPGRPLPPEKHTLYVLDEPTVGLHMADVEKLIQVLHRLAGAGHTVMVIEHDLDLMAEADWIIDLGPEGGDGGGEIVAEGPPEAVVQVARSHTGRILGEFLATRRRDAVPG